MKNTPILLANGNWYELAILAAKKAPANVPKAWARKGKIKLVSSQFMALIESNPSDTGIRLLPKIMSPILTIIHNNTPVIKAKIFLIIFFGKYKKAPPNW